MTDKEHTHTHCLTWICQERHQLICFHSFSVMIILLTSLFMSNLIKTLEKCDFSLIKPYLMHIATNTEEAALNCIQTVWKWQVTQMNAQLLQEWCFGWILTDCKPAITVIYTIYHERGKCNQKSHSVSDSWCFPEGAAHHEVKLNHSLLKYSTFVCSMNAFVCWWEWCQTFYMSLCEVTK